MDSCQDIQKHNVITVRSAERHLELQIIKFKIAGKSNLKKTTKEKNGIGPMMCCQSAQITARCIRSRVGVVAIYWYALLDGKIENLGTM